MMDELFKHAAELGVGVEFTNLKHLHRNGDYSARHHLIRLQDGMMPRKTRHVFAHELAHAYYRDEPSMLEHLNHAHERRADEVAAHILIRADEYREAEERFNGHTESIAAELYVLPRTVDAYRRTLCRIGDDVYVRPKHGVGQWHAKYRAVA